MVVDLVGHILGACTEYLTEFQASQAQIDRSRLEIERGTACAFRLSFLIGIKLPANRPSQLTFYTAILLWGLPSILQTRQTRFFFTLFYNFTRGLLLLLATEIDSNFKHLV